IAAGRPGLAKEKLAAEVVVDRPVPKRDEKGNVVTENGSPVTVRYTRVRADGGSFTAEEARKFGRVGRVGERPAAIRAPAAAAEPPTARARRRWGRIRRRVLCWLRLGFCPTVGGARAAGTVGPNRPGACPHLRAGSRVGSGRYRGKKRGDFGKVKIGRTILC